MNHKSEEEQIKDLYRNYWDCMIRKDAAGLQDIMSDAYTLRHMTGTRQSREEFIDGLLAGTFNYYSAEHDGIDVKINGETAVMTGKSRVVAAVYGGRKHLWRLQGDFTLRKEQGKWKLSSSRASTY